MRLRHLKWSALDLASGVSWRWVCWTISSRCKGWGTASRSSRSWDPCPSRRCPAHHHRQVTRVAPALPTLPPRLLHPLFEFLVQPADSRAADQAFLAAAASERDISAADGDFYLSLPFFPALIVLGWSDGCFLAALDRAHQRKGLGIADIPPRHCQVGRRRWGRYWQWWSIYRFAHTWYVFRFVFFFNFCIVSPSASPSFHFHLYMFARRPLLSTRVFYVHNFVVANIVPPCGWDDALKGAGHPFYSPFGSLFLPSSQRFI